MTFDPSVAGKGLGARLVDIESAMERLGSFAFDPTYETPLPPRDRDAEVLDAARELVLRALAAMGDAVNFGLLGHLAEGDASLDDLAATAGLAHLAVWERVNDLVQVGLVSRALDGNRAGLTGAGHALVSVVEEIAEAAVQGRGR